MNPYRSDLDAAFSQIEALKAEIEELKAERSTALAVRKEETSLSRREAVKGFLIPQIEEETKETLRKGTEIAAMAAIVPLYPVVAPLFGKNQAERISFGISSAAIITAQSVFMSMMACAPEFTFPAILALGGMSWITGVCLSLGHLVHTHSKSEEGRL
jgi:hypothetical protein